MQQNLFYTHERQKQAYNKGVILRSYVLGEKVGLNNKYIRTKPHPKLKAKFLSLFQVFYLVDKQVYKRKQAFNLKIKDIFNISLVEQDRIRKKQVMKFLNKSLIYGKITNMRLRLAQIVQHVSRTRAQCKKQ